MRSWVTTWVGVAVVAVAIWTAARGFRAPAAIGHDPHRGSTHDDGKDSDEHDDGGGLLFALGDGGGGGSATEAGSFLTDLVEPGTRFGNPAGVTMPDGSRVPPLLPGAPRQVRFGVVLVSYAGAEPSPGGSKPATRSKEDARVLADRLLSTAQQDFHAAVQQGDAGSADDVGRVRLGVLEPAPEYVLFSLPVDGVAGPVDTPRGYWVVKRLE